MNKADDPVTLHIDTFSPPPGQPQGIAPTVATGRLLVHVRLTVGAIPCGCPGGGGD